MSDQDTGKENNSENELNGDSWSSRIMKKKTLQELRQDYGFIQKSLAERMGMTTQRVSEMEKSGFNQRIASIATHVEALGGRLKIVAEFDDSPPVEIVDQAMKKFWLLEEQRRKKTEGTGRD